MVHLLRLLTWPAAVVGASLSLTLLTLRAWELDLRIPFRYSEDGGFYLLVVKSILDHGWYLRNPDLGAPFGQKTYDFPLGADNLNVLLIKGLGLFTSDPAVVTNLFFLLTFVLIALSAFLVFGRLGVSRPVALVCALLFTFLPYHMLRGPGHLFLSSYFAVPIGLFLALSVLGNDQLFMRRDGVARWRARVNGRALAIVGLCAVVASTGIYYAVFTLALVIVAGVLAAGVRRQWEPFGATVVIASVILVVLVINLSPSIVYRLKHGPNPIVSARNPNETEYYSINPARLLIPLPSHRFDPAARLGERYAATSPLPAAGEGTGYIGAVAGLGFVGLLSILLISAVGNRSRAPERVRHAAVVAAVCLLIGTTGGLATIYAYLINPELHGAGRISLFIAFLSLFAVGVLLDRLWAWLDFRHGTLVFVVILAGVLLFGVYDETPNPYSDRKPIIAAEWKSDKSFVQEIEELLPEGAMVFQLPHVSFPHDGSVVGDLGEYDQARAYVNSDELRWSYGAMNERPEEWQDELAASPLPEAVRRLAATGFGGIYIDRRGYGDNGQHVEGVLRQVLASRPLVSPNGRLSFFDLRPFAASLRRKEGSAQIKRLRESTLYPVAIEWATGFSPPESGNGRSWRWADWLAVVILANPSDTPRKVQISGSVATGYPEPAWLTASLPDGEVVRVNVSSMERPFRLATTLQPGRNELRFITNARRVQPAPGDTRSLYFVLFEPRIE
jgi:hypothetical protein